MDIVVEVKNEILGDSIFWRGPAERIAEIRNIPARETAMLVVQDGKTRVDGMWHVSAAVPNEMIGHTGAFSAPKQTASDEIKTVRQVSKDGGDYVVKCPHCGRVLGVEGDDLSEIRGEQYKDRICGGWLQVDYDALFVREL